MEVKRVSSNKTLNTYEKKLSREVKCVTMSRSYKHTPVYKVGSIIKLAKRQAKRTGHTNYMNTGMIFLKVMMRCLYMG